MAFTMALECPECGNIVNSKDWQDCGGMRGKRHAAVGIYQVLNWGKRGDPRINGGIENKGVYEENESKSTIPEEIGGEVGQDTHEVKI